MDSKRLLSAAAFVLCTLCGTPALAHPGSGIVVDRHGQVYFVVPGQSHIMKIDGEGRLTTFVSDDRLRLPHHLVIDEEGNIYTASDDDGIVWRISPDGSMSQFFSISGGGERPHMLLGMYGDPFTIDPAGNIYCTLSNPQQNRFQNRIFRIDSSGEAILLAGSNPGYADGRGSDAQFESLHYSSMALGPDGLLYVTDRAHVRTVTPDGSVSTLAMGGAEIFWGSGLAVDGQSNVYVADYRGRRVLKIDPDGQATTVAGPARVFAPVGVALGPDGNIYILDADTFGTRVLKVSVGGNVTTLATLGGSAIQIAMISVIALGLPLLLVIWLWQRPLGGVGNTIVWSTLVGLIVVMLWLASGTMPPSHFLRHVRLLRHLVLIFFIATAVRSFLRAREAGGAKNDAVTAS